MRKPRPLATALEGLGIRRIILRSLIGTVGATPPVEALRTLGLLRASMPALDVEVDPIDVLTIAPWFSPAWEEGEDAFGHVDLIAWKQAYYALAPQNAEEAV